MTSLTAFPRPAARTLNIYFIYNFYTQLPAIVERHNAAPKNVSIVSPCSITNICKIRLEKQSQITATSITKLSTKPKPMYGRPVSRKTRRFII